MRILTMAVAIVLVLAAGAWASVARTNSDASVTLAGELAELERELGNRIGVFALDTASGRLFGYRADERFASASTFKALLAGVVLHEAAKGTLSLEDTVTIGDTDIAPHSPLLAKLDGAAPISLATLCQAAVELSDNTATNLLLAKLGGPHGFTALLRELGDRTTRLDRWEPELNENSPGDVRDTTTPAALTTSLAMFLDDTTLVLESRSLLTSWLRQSKTGHARLRAGFPDTWTVGDKTGSGANGAYNDVAVIWPNRETPIIVSVFMDGGGQDMATHNAAHARIAAAVSMWIDPLEAEQDVGHEIRMSEHTEALSR